MFGGNIRKKFDSNYGSREKRRKMAVMTAEHIWVKHVITPVHVLEDDQGDRVVLVDPDQQIISEDEAVYGCDRCGVPMIESTMHTECEIPL
jgi:hypothetical protein